MLRLNEDLFEDPMIFTGSDQSVDTSSPQINPNDNAVCVLLSNALQDELTGLDQYNSLIVSLPDGYETIKCIVNGIIEQKNIQIGQLQAALSLVDPKMLLRKQSELQTLNSVQ